uniref:Uncharacterized protein n=1 Tax=Arundo donax TaxID=35708 RepID=A0A0A9G0G4_ARUDO
MNFNSHLCKDILSLDNSYPIFLSSWASKYAISSNAWSHLVYIVCRTKNLHSFRCEF